MTLIDRTACGISASGATAPGGRRSWLIVGLLTGFLIINYADKVVVGLSGVELMKKPSAWIAAQFGVVQSSFYWLFAVGSIGGGMLIGRVPAKWLLSATALFWVLAMMPMIWSDSYEVLIASRVALGLAEGPATAMAIAVAHSWIHRPIVVPCRPSVVTAGAGLARSCCRAAVDHARRRPRRHAASSSARGGRSLLDSAVAAFGRWGLPTEVRSRRHQFGADLAPSAPRSRVPAAQPHPDRDHPPAVRHLLQRGDQDRSSVARLLPAGPRIGSRAGGPALRRPPLRRDCTAPGRGRLGFRALTRASTCTHTHLAWTAALGDAAARGPEHSRLRVAGHEVLNLMLVVVGASLAGAAAGWR